MQSYVLLVWLHMGSYPYCIKPNPIRISTCRICWNLKIDVETMLVCLDTKQCLVRLRHWNFLVRWRKNMSVMYSSGCLRVEGRKNRRAPACTQSWYLWKSILDGTLLGFIYRRSIQEGILAVFGGTEGWSTLTQAGKCPHVFLKMWSRFIISNLEQWSLTLHV